MQSRCEMAKISTKSSTTVIPTTKRIHHTLYLSIIVEALAAVRNNAFSCSGCLGELLLKLRDVRRSSGIRANPI